MSETPKIIEYTNILHKYGLNSEQARSYKLKNFEDKTFIGRADVLDMLFALNENED